MCHGKVKNSIFPRKKHQKKFWFSFHDHKKLTLSEIYDFFDLFAYRVLQKLQTFLQKMNFCFFKCNRNVPEMWFPLKYDYFLLNLFANLAP
jgi:hypothetical protein